MSIRRHLAAKSAEKRKLSDEDSERIRVMHASGKHSIAGLARMYQCDPRTIQGALVQRPKSPWLEQRGREGR